MIFQKLRAKIRHRKHSERSPEEALKQAKSWQVVFAAILMVSVGTYLSVPVVKSSTLLVEAVAAGKPVFRNLSSVMLLADLYLLAWISYTALSLAKDFAGELRKRWVRL